MKRITSPSSVSRMHNENDSVLKDGGWNEGRKFQRELLRRYEEEGE